MGTLPDSWFRFQARSPHSYQTTLPNYEASEATSLGPKLESEHELHTHVCIHPCLFPGVLPGPSLHEY